MKKLFSTVAALILAANLWAGVPQGFSFQAVVRNAQGELVQNSSNVSVKVSILKDAADDNSAVYAETATAATNANGLLTMQIGAGTPVEGSFEKIDWAQGPFFIKTEIDINGGENYSISSVQQLLSVPFAMVADKANNVPAKVSDLDNDANYVSADKIAAYLPTKVTDLENDANFVSADTFASYVVDVNKLTGIIQVSNYVKADTLNSYAKTNQNISSFNNDAKYITEGSNISLFTNDANYVTSSTLNSYAKSNQNISSFNNDAKYISEDTLNVYAKTDALKDTLSYYALKSELPDGVDLSTYLHNGSNISKLNNDAKYVKEGENISKLNNDAKYISKSEVDEKLASLNSQLAGEGMVDLGLPSGTLWATCNVGASNPWEIGDYFAWGETTTKTEFTEENYTGSGEYENGQSLKPEDDAATVNMGAQWRTPTSSQWTELFSNCYAEAVTKYKDHNVNGYIIYKAKDVNDKGKRSNPIASYSSLNDVHIFVHYTSSTDGFWTSNFSTNATAFAYNTGYKKGSNFNIYRQFLVRAVTTASVKVAQNATNATNAVTANKATQYIGDMPLAKVTVKVVDSYNVATASFLGQDIKNGSQTFVVPAYSPVFLSVALSKYTQEVGTDFYPYEYTYSVKINDEYFDNTGFEYDRTNENVYNSLETYSLNNYVNGSYLLSINSYKEEEVMKYRNNPYVNDRNNHKNKDEFYLPIVDNMYDYSCDGTDSDRGDNRYGNNQMENQLYIGVSDNEDLFPIYKGSEGLCLGGVRIDKNQHYNTLMGISHINSSIVSHYDIYAHMPNWIYRNSYTTLKTYKVGRGYKVDKYNNEYLNADMKNQTVGPFPNAENTITITIMRAGGGHIVN